MPEKLAVNLIPEEEAKRRSREKIFRWILTYGRYIIIGTEIIVLLAFLARFKLDRDLKQTSDEVKAKQEAVESFGELETQTRILQVHLATIKNLDEKNPPPTQILNALAALTPYDVIFSQLKISSTKINVSATALSLGGFSSFIENLKRSKNFEDVSIERVKEGQSGIEFTFQVNYQRGQK